MPCLYRFLAFVIALPLCLGLVSARAQAPGAAADASPVLYSIVINGEKKGDAALLRLHDGPLLASGADLLRWRLRPPDAPAQTYRGEKYYPMSAYEGAEAKLDGATQELTLTIPTRYFAATVVAGAGGSYAVPKASTLGGFGNYDWLLSGTGADKRLDGQFELGVFGPPGVGVGGFLLQDVGRETRFVRLDTAWTHDMPENMNSLTLGDTIGASGIWGRPVRFGGIRYGTNFATRPGFIAYPLPAVSGLAALPTTTELFVNGILQQSANVSPGPFQITNLPVVTGEGEVRLVVKDLLGREQVIMQPYYASSALLKEGLHDDSYELGFVRNSFGVRSDDYGRAVATLQRREGLSDAFTGEVRAEILNGQQTGGGGGSLLLPGVGVITGGAAVSHGPSGTGELASAAFERTAQRDLSVAVHAQWTTADFVQLGQLAGQAAPLRTLSASLGYAPRNLGSFGLSYVQQDNRGEPDVRVLSASYSVSVGKRGALVASAYKTLSGDRSGAVSITYSLAFGERSSAAANRIFQKGQSSDYVQVQQNLPAGSGTGYRVLAGRDALGEKLEAGEAVQTGFGNFTAEASREDGATAYRLDANGGFGVVEGHGFASRNLSDSFGIAQVPGFANTGVYVNNQLIARTDAQGYAVLPRLLPYQPNAVSIDADQLPLDAEIGATELNATPYLRSGLLIRFPVKLTAGALLTLVLDDGLPMPVGASVKVVGADADFPVAERGEAFITGLEAHNRVAASWHGQHCDFNLDLPKDAGPVPRVGPIVCSGVAR